MRGWAQHQVRPLCRPFSVTGPVTIEYLLHPFWVGGTVAALDDALQIDFRAARGIVGALAGDGIVQHHRIGHT